VIELRIAGAIHLGQAAGAERRHDFIRSESRADWKLQKMCGQIIEALSRFRIVNCSSSDPGCGIVPGIRDQGSGISDQDGRVIYAILERDARMMDLVTIDVATGALHTL
jgi:hypothetical protein